MQLIFPTMEHKQAALDYFQEHYNNNEMHINGSSGYSRDENYETWLERITLAQTTVPPGWVPGSTYFGIVDGEIVGTIAIRHCLNDSLINSGGHIGYGVRPTQRRKGYASKMLALALQKCPGFGIEKALVTCDKGNIGSAKTIMKNGGVFENEFTEESGNVVERYWILL